MKLGHPKPKPRGKPPRARKARKPIPRSKPGQAPKRPVPKHQHPAWRNKRARVLRRDKYWCRICDRRKATQVHHTEYGRGRKVKSLVDVPDASLLSVCDDCHAELHPWMREPR